MFLLLKDTLKTKTADRSGIRTLQPERSALDRSAILPGKNIFLRAFVFVVTSAHQRRIVGPNTLKNEFQRCFFLLNDTLKTETADRSGIRTDASDDTAT